MRFRFLLISAALFCASAAARTEVITTFTLTHGTDTFQFSLTPSTPLYYSTPAPYQAFGYEVPLTIDGATIYPGAGPASSNPNEGFEYQQPLGVGAEFYIQYVTGTSNGTTYFIDLFEQGMQLYTSSGGVPAFTPGTYVFTQVYVANIAVTGGKETLLSEPLEPGDTLVITQSDLAATPEPSTFWLIGTGLMGTIGIAVRRHVIV